MSSSDRKSYSADETRDSVHVISGGSELKVAEVRLTNPTVRNRSDLRSSKLNSQIAAICSHNYQFSSRL